jgi:hypothetical protein
MPPRLWIVMAFMVLRQANLNHQRSPRFLVRIEAMEGALIGAARDAATGGGIHYDQRRLGPTSEGAVARWQRRALECAVIVWFAPDEDVMTATIRAPRYHVQPLAPGGMRAAHRTLRIGIDQHNGSTFVA